MKKRNLSMAMKMKIHMLFFNPVSEGKPLNPPSNLRNQPPQSRMVFMQSFRTALLIWRSLLVGVNTALPPEELTRRRRHRLAAGGAYSSLRFCISELRRRPQRHY
ncbi:hypothetical protein L1887_38129 [Cichorium endivia]|nr:hypothetical protein L1887_38129 [Cichorium endivia]